jgi:4-hydroxy-tetrahydrodipicolinate reductase
MQPIKTIIHGAAGRVGQVLVTNLSQSPEVKLVGAVDIKVGSPELTLPDGSRIPFASDLARIIRDTQPAVMVDFSLAGASLPAVRIAAAHHVNLVIGTTGFSAANLAEMQQLAETQDIGIILAPNFAVGAVLMTHLAKLAAKFLDYAEIIELHHDQKADAPSGTALNTARAMAASRGKPFSQAVDAGKNYPSRGEKVDGVTVHSVRLPGLMAHQEVIFGGLGQTLTIRHDAISRECFVPGVLLAVQAVVRQKGFVQGLDKILGL